VLLLSEDGHIALAGERGRSWFASYFGGDARPGDRLPDRVDAWLRDRRDGSERVAEPPLVIERQGHRFVVRLLPEAGPATHRILVLEEHRDLMAAEELECFGLTHREAEILAWVSHGKSDAEIASILHVSQRTVAKHLEHTYEKLDVHSRTAAIARVRGVDPQ
jgi:DNA-binding CsgD family transcriptional regulator